MRPTSCAVACLLFAVPSLAHGQGETSMAVSPPGDADRQVVFHWQDSDGSLSFTNSVQDVPRGATGAEGAEISVVSSEHLKGPPIVGTSADDEAREESQLRATWQPRFAAAHDRIHRAERALDDARLQLEAIVHRQDVGQLRPMTADAFAAFYGEPELERTRAELRVKASEEDLARAREDLAELERDASRHSVPQRLRH